MDPFAPQNDPLTLEGGQYDQHVDDQKHGRQEHEDGPFNLEGSDHNYIDDDEDLEETVASRVVLRMIRRVVVAQEDAINTFILENIQAIGSEYFRGSTSVDPIEDEYWMKEIE
ncbi:hypothetical protein V6N13_007880 [Hibiscus sabdariffa]|uniref:Uncharacterized protein n=1 Tax=Hibiscus sabdariffa TaxID=183260 RepID=A0ABR2EC52_9ROSI